MPLKDFRGFLDRLREEGDLVAVSDATSPKFGIAAGIRKTSDVGGADPALRARGRQRIPVVGAVYASRRRLLWGFETDAAGFFSKFEWGLANPIPPKVVDDTPCQEVRRDRSASRSRTGPTSRELRSSRSRAGSGDDAVTARAVVALVERGKCW